MKIGYDARFLNETGVGRYIQNTLPLMINASNKDSWVLLVKNTDTKLIRSLIGPVGLKRVKIIKTSVLWHTLKEQIIVPYVFYKEKVDILHVPYVNVPIFYFKKLVTTIHDLTILTHKTGKASTHGWLMYKLKRIGFRLALFRAIHSYQILVVSNSVKTELLNRFNKINPLKVHVTPNGYNKLPTPKTKAEVVEVEDFFKLHKITKFRPYFFYVGNMHPHKNINLAIETLSKYFIKHPNYSFILAGRKDYFMEKIIEKISGLPNKNNFHFFANPTDGQLNILYRGSKVVILPSLKEGFGLQVLEAMSLGSLILCSKIPAYIEVGGKICEYFDPSSPRSMLISLNKLLSIPRSAKQDILVQYKQNLKHYSWKETAKDTLYIYKNSPKLIRKNLKILPSEYK